MSRIAIVAPTFNEQENISSFIDAIFSEAKKIHGCETFLIISDSHSSDDTANIVERKSRTKKNLVYLDVKKRGLGLGIREGLNYAVDKLKADYLITIEADLSNDPKKILRIVELLKKYDLVIGSRYIRGGGIKNWSWWRKKLSFGANLGLRLLALSKIHEYTNLYRGFNRLTWMKLRGRLNRYDGWLFVPAFIFEFLSIGMSSTEMPFIYFDRFGGRSKMRTLSYTKNLLLYALSYRMNRISSWFSHHQ